MKGGAVVAVGLLLLLLVVGLVLFAMKRKRTVTPVAAAKPGAFNLVGQGIGSIIGNWGSWSSGSATRRSGQDSIGSGGWDWFDNIGRPDSGASLGTGGLRLMDDTFSGSLYGGSGKADQFGYQGPAGDAPQPLAAMAEAYPQEGERLVLSSGTTPGGSTLFDFGN